LGQSGALALQLLRQLRQAHVRLVERPLYGALAAVERGPLRIQPVPLVPHALQRSLHGGQTQLRFPQRTLQRILGVRQACPSGGGGGRGGGGRV